METTRTTVPDQRLGDELTMNAGHSEWNAVGLRPIAHWVQMPSPNGGHQLSMVWEVPNPLPGSAA